MPAQEVVEGMAAVMVQVAELAARIALVLYGVVQHACNIPAFPVGHDGKDDLLEEDVAVHLGVRTAGVVHAVLIHKAEYLPAVAVDEAQVRTAEEAHVVGCYRLFLQALVDIVGQPDGRVLQDAVHHTAVVDGAYLAVLGNERGIHDPLGERLGDEHVAIHMYEGFRLHGVGLYL